MRTLSIVACLALPFLDSARGQDAPQAKPDIGSLEKRAAELECQLATVKKELQEVRDKLQVGSKVAVVHPRDAKAGLSPAEAVKQGAKKTITVEFGVGSATFLLDKQRPYGSGPVPPIVLEWDNALTDGGGFFVLLSGNAVSQHVMGAVKPADEGSVYPSVRNLEQFCKEIKGRGIRATGRIQEIGPSWSKNYQLILDDPENFKIIK